ncbi:MAG TPA: NfeD family protein [Pirellulales bacterium]
MVPVAERRGQEAWRAKPLWQSSISNLAGRCHRLLLSAFGLLAFLTGTTGAPNRLAADEAASKAEAANPVKPAAKQAVGHLIRISVPIDGDVYAQVRAAVSRLADKSPPGAGPRPILIFEFWPGQADGGRGSTFGNSLELAKFIARDLSRFKTVAYIPRTIKGHAVLVAMACDEIVMAPDAEIGDAGIDETTIDPTTRSGYLEIAAAHKSVAPALALGMLDKNVKVLKVVTDQATEFVLPSELDELKKHRTIQKQEELSPSPGLFSGREARDKLGTFVSRLVKDRQDVARAFDLPPEAVRDDPSLFGGTWKPVQVPLKGIITTALVSETKKKINDQVAEGVNFICLTIDSAGGSPNDSMDLANFLAGDLDPSKVRTVAYIPKKARGDAALIAIACDQIVMARDAVIGGSGDYQMKPDEIDIVSRMLRDVRNAVPKKKGIHWSLPVAMIDQSLKVYRYTNTNTGQKECFSVEELAADAAAGAWQQGELITPNTKPLLLTGERAEELGLAWRTARDMSEFRRLYGIENEQMPVVEPGWADFLISAMSSPSILGFLLFLGLAGVIAEIYAPGHGVGGFIALVSFLLYFWIQHLHGTAGWLEVILFLAGVGCLLLEIFVLPGLAIFGLGGGLMIIFSLVLASQTFLIPKNDYQWEQMRTTMMTISGAVLGATAAAIVFRRYLPKTPGINRMLLQPPSGEERETIATREALVDFSHLVGQIGVATTPLMPSGKARFSGRLIDVIAGGEAIDRGTQVKVVEVRGNHVLVQPAGRGPDMA